MDMRELADILGELVQPDLDDEEMGDLATRLEKLGTTPSRTGWIIYTMATFAATIMREQVGKKLGQELPDDVQFGLRYGDLQFPAREFAQAVSCLLNRDEDMARDIIINASSYDGETAGEMVGFAMGYIQVAYNGVERGEDE